MTAGGDHFLIIGVVLGTLASMTGTAGKQFMRLSELRRQRGAVWTGKLALAMGLVLNVLVGPLLDMGSYAFAPQSVIAPLSGLDVVWNTLTAPFTLGETLTCKLFCGCAVITGGAVVTSLVGSHDSGDFTIESMQAILLRPTVGIYLLVLAAWVAFNVTVLIPRSAAPKGQPWQSGDRIRGLSLGMTAGSISGNMFCVKAFVEVCQDSVLRGKAEHWAHWLPYGLFAGALFFALSNLYFLIKAMREYEALFMAAVFEGSLIISACISGVVVFSEMEKLKGWQVGVYWASIMFIVWGIFIVSANAKKEARPEPKDKEEQEPPKSVDVGVQVDMQSIRVELPQAVALQSMGKQSRVHRVYPTCELVAEEGPRLPPAAAFVGVVPSAGQTHCSSKRAVATPSSKQSVQGVSCVCADGISCFWGVHVTRSRSPPPATFGACSEGALVLAD